MTPWEDRAPRTSRKVRSDQRYQSTIGTPSANPCSDPSSPKGESVVEARHGDDAVLLILVGEFDLMIAAVVQEALTRAISQRRRRLIVDLSRVTFIDSSGVHVILDAYKVCGAGHIQPKLTIRPGPANVQRVFELTNLLGCLPFEVSG